MRTKRLLGLAAAVIAAGGLSVAGCGDDATIPVTLVRVEVTPATATVHVGTTQQYIATAVYSDATTEDVSANATWASDDEAVATIDAAGEATGVSAGTVEISALFNEITGTATLTVEDAQVTQVIVEPPNATINVGDTTDFTARAVYDDGTDEDVTDTAVWNSSDDAIATVDAGTVTGEAVGTATITAAFGGETSNAATVIVSELHTLDEIQITPPTATIPVDGEQPYIALGTFLDGTTEDITADVTWDSSDPAVATIDAAGVATGVAAGETTITAAMDGITSNDATLTVTEAPLVSVTVDPVTGTLHAGSAETLALTATANYADGSSADVTTTATWASSDDTIATVSNAAGTEGVVSPDAANIGVAQITATFDGVTSGPAIINVVVSSVVTDVEVAPATASIVAGTTQAFMATATFEDGRTSDVTATATWTSSALAIASVAVTGVATGLTPGAATITATYTGVAGTATLTVTDATIVSIAVEPPVATIARGNTQAFTATATLTDGTTRDVTASATWTSSSTATATMAGATATGVAIGTATITATAGTPPVSGTALLNVTDPVLTGINVTPATSTIPVAGTVTLTATGTYSDGSTADITALATWTSSATATASVAGGLVTGVAAGGPVTITATRGTISGTAQVTVSGGILQTISITPGAPPSLPIGRTQSFTATGTYSDGTTADLTAHANLTWTTSVGTVASVSNAAGSDGVATGLAVGATNIGCYYDDGVRPRVTATPVALAVTTAVLTSIAVTPATPTLPATFSLQFTATGTYSDATTADITNDPLIVWTSATTAVATMSGATKGLATAVAPGASVITAAVGSVSGNTTLTVNSATLVSISITPQPATVQVGATRQFTATGNFSDGSTMPLTTLVTWASGDVSRATISNAAGSNGLATGVAPVASVSITATRGSIVGAGTLSVTNPLTLQSIAVTVVPTTIPVGLTGQATAIGTYSDGVTTTTQTITDTVTWYTSSAAIATISNAAGSRGLITGVAGGTANISATLGAVASNIVAVNVTTCALINPITVTAAPAGNNIPRGTSRQYRAEAGYNTAGACSGLGGVVYDLTNVATWASSNTANATVSNAAGTKGLVTASSTPTGSPATSDISATYTGGLTGTTTVTINPACVQTLTVTPATVSLPKGGIISPLTATARMSDGTDVDFTTQASWSRTAGTAATVDDAAGFKGLVTTGATAGSATMRATAPAGTFCGATAPTADSVVTVTDATLTSISVTPSAPSVVRGGTVQLQAVGTFSDSSNVNITRSASWTSSVTSVATVSDTAPTKGLVTGVTNGNSIVTANFMARAGTANVVVSGKTLVSIAVDVDPAFVCPLVTAGTFPLGITVPMRARGTYSDTSVDDITTSVTWASSSTANVTIAGTGVATTVSGGSSNITATIGSVVSPAYVMGVASGALGASLSLDPPNLNWWIGIGLTRQFHAYGTFTGVTTGGCDITSTVTWTATSLTPPATPPLRLSMSAAGLGTATTVPANAGAVRVTATRGASSGTTDGWVTAACVTGITVTPATVSLARGQVRTLVANRVTVDGTSTPMGGGDTVTWTGATGNVTLAAGTTGTKDITGATAGTDTVTASYNAAGATCFGMGPTFQATSDITVTAATLTGITVTCVEQDWTGDTVADAIPVGITSQCTATGTYSAGAPQNITDSVTWASTAPATATVSDTAPTKGLARGLAAGNAVISATQGAISNFTVLHVNAAVLRTTNPIVITPAGPVSLPVGFTQLFRADGYYTLGGATNSYNITELATWTSSTPAFATVSDAAGSKGRANTVAIGTTTITAGYQTRTGTASLTVNNATLASIAVTPATTAIGLGLTQQYRADGTYTDSSVKDITTSVTWTTSDAAYVTIAAGGLATGVQVTTAPITITATQGTISGTAQLNVNAKCISSLDLTPATRTIPANVPIVFTATANYSDGTTGNVTATVAFSNGGSTRMGVPDTTGYTYSEPTATAGTVTIGASIVGCSGTATDTSTITITNATLASIAVTPTSASTPVSTSGAITVSYQATGTYSDSSSADITRRASWSTGNPAIATVGAATGVVTGVAVGTTSVTASQGARSGAATVDVTAGVLTALSVEGWVTLGGCGTTWNATGIAHPMGGYYTMVRALGTFSDGRTGVDMTESVTWSSNQPTRATVSNTAGQRGLVTTGTAAGAVVVTATSGTITDTLALDVVNATPTVVQIEGSDPVGVNLGNTAQLTLRARFGLTDYYCATENATWSCGNAAVATVSNVAGDRGLVSTVSVGSAVITGTIGTLSDTVTVNVGAATLSYIEVLPTTVSLCRSCTAQFRSWGHYSDGTVNDITANVTPTETHWSIQGAAGGCSVTVNDGASKGLVNAGATACTGARIEACNGSICASAAPDRRGTVTVP
ncbi:MAG: Ig-like domain-containing protein [Deltaproteobacteria bacterium]|nr:Ig-like domain-containing protein [Deltaproteobacteria bacterium]